MADVVISAHDQGGHLSRLVQIVEEDDVGGNACHSSVEVESEQDGFLEKIGGVSGQRGNFLECSGACPGEGGKASGPVNRGIVGCPVDGVEKRTHLFAIRVVDGEYTKV